MSLNIEFADEHAVHIRGSFTRSQLLGDHPRTEYWITLRIKLTYAARRRLTQEAD